MAHCTGCGNPLRPGSAHCTHCGRPAPVSKVAAPALPPTRAAHARTRAIAIGAIAVMVVGLPVLLLGRGRLALTRPEPNFPHSLADGRVNVWAKIDQMR